MTLEYHCRSNSGGCLMSLNTASPRWQPFKWDIRFVVLKLDAFFSSSQNPCWTFVANSNGIVLLCHREKLPDRWRHVHRWWRNERDTSWESLQFKTAVTCTRKADESQINQTDWLIYQQATLSDLVIGFHLFIGAIKMTSFSPISVDNLSVR